MEDPVVVPEKGGVMLEEASHYDNFSDLECHCARKFQDNAPLRTKNSLLHYFKDRPGKLFTADQTLVLYSGYVQNFLRISCNCSTCATPTTQHLSLSSP